MSKKNKTPLESQVMTGYMISKSVAKFTEYMTEALHCLDEAIIDMNEDNTPTDNLEAYEARKLMYRSLSDVHGKAEKAHVILADIMQAKGYRKLTTDDFALFGVTRR